MSKKQQAFLWISGWSVPEEIWSPFYSEWPEYQHVALSLNRCEQESKMIQQAIQTFEQIEAGEVNVVGWSLGALIALELALRFPEQIHHLFLVGGVADFVKRKSTDLGWDERVIRRMKKQLCTSKRDVIRAFDRKMFSSIELEEGWEKKWQMAIREQLPSLASLQAGLDFLQQFSLGDRGKQITIPVFLLAGSEDVICPAEATLHLAKQFPRGDCTIWKKSGHACFWTQKEHFQQWIKRCLYEEHP